VLAIFIGVGRAHCSSNAARLSWLADQVYFLGYLCTITAVGGLLLRVAVDERALEDTRFLLLTSCIALTTIVIGLMGMSTLKAQAQWEARALPAEAANVEEFMTKLSRALEGTELLPQLTNLAASIKEIFGNIGSLRKNSEESEKAVQSLQNSLGELSAAVQALRTELTKTTPRAEEFADSVEESLQALDQFDEMMKTRISAGEGSSTEL
jgi:methyl-accepting chemotaxis protein